MFVEICPIYCYGYYRVIGSIRSRGTPPIAQLFYSALPKKYK